MTSADALHTYHGVLTEFAKELGWQFEFDGEMVVAQDVFDPALFAPGLLAASQAELTSRGVNASLGVGYERDPNAMFGVRAVVRGQEGATRDTVASMWRIVQTIEMIASLPLHGNRIMLDLVPAAVHALCVDVAAPEARA